MSNPSIRTTAACWYVYCVAVVTLFAYGLSQDTSKDLRDAIIELSILMDGPTPRFVEICKEQENEPEPQNSTLEEIIRRQLDSYGDHKLKVRGLLWCPFPPHKMTVKDALDLVTPPMNRCNTLYPSSRFIEKLKHDVADAKSEPGKLNELERDNKYARYSSIIRDLALGKKINRITVTSVPPGMYNPGGECPDRDAVYDAASTYKDMPPFPIELTVQINESGDYCLHAKDIPFEHYHARSGLVQEGPYMWYFGERIDRIPGYSNKEASKRGIRNLQPGDSPTDENGINRPNLVFGFDFPALKSQLKDIGTMTIEDAYNTLKSTNSNKKEDLEIFGAKLSANLFIAVVTATLLLLSVYLTSGLFYYGLLSLPESIGGFPRPILILIIVALIIAPAVGFHCASHRILLERPDIAGYLHVVSMIWRLAAPLGLLVLACATASKNKATPSITGK